MFLLFKMCLLEKFRLSMRHVLYFSWISSILDRPQGVQWPLGARENLAFRTAWSVVRQASRLTQSCSFSTQHRVDAPKICAMGEGRTQRREGEREEGRQEKGRKGRKKGRRKAYTVTLREIKAEGVGESASLSDGLLWASVV